MPESTTAVLAEPKAKGDTAAEVKSSNAEPITTATVAGKVYDGSGVLDALDSDQYRKWRLGDDSVVEGVEPKKPAEKSVPEHEQVLEDKKVHRAWLEGKEPERPEPAPAKEESKENASNLPAEVAELEKVSSPVAKFSVNAGKMTDELKADAMKMESTFADRLQKEAAKVSEAEKAQLQEQWNTVAYPQIVEKLGKESANGFLAAINKAVVPFLHAPFAFRKELATNEAFRRDIVMAGFAPGGNFSKVIGVIARFDAKHAPAPTRKVSAAPAPAASVSGKATAPVDEEAAALSGGEFRRYMNAANHSDWLRRTGGRS